MSLDSLRIALVHDELTRRGGAEAVFEEICRMFPAADVYALYAGQPIISINNITRPINTTFLQKFPLWMRRHPSRLLPWLPFAAEQLDFSNYDIVVSSSSGFAKAIITRSNVPHLCYCHTPTRYLWSDYRAALQRSAGGSRWLARLLLHQMRLFDFAAAQRVDKFLANSEWTRQRVASFYRRSADVLYPPIDTTFFTPTPNQKYLKSFFLCVGRLNPSKHFDQTIAVCEKLRLPLIIVGQGPELPRLKKIAGKYTLFAGKVSPEKLRDYYRQARALIQPAEEDFGMASVEAQACGTPVIAYGQGGALEAARQGITGILYSQPTVEALAEAVRVFIEKEHAFIPENLQQQAMRFSRERFKEGLKKHVESLVS